MTGRRAQRAARRRNTKSITYDEICLYYFRVEMMMEAGASGPKFVSPPLPTTTPANFFAYTRAAEELPKVVVLVKIRSTKEKNAVIKSDDKSMQISAVWLVLHDTKVKINVMYVDCKRRKIKLIAHTH